MTWAAAFAIAAVSVCALRAWEVTLDYRRDMSECDCDEGDELDVEPIERDVVVDEPRVMVQ